MNGPESKPWVWPMRSPSLTRAPARDTAASAANRHARGERRGSSRARAVKPGAPSADSCIARRLHQLTPAVQLVSLGGAVAAVPADARAQRGPHALDVAAHGVDGRAVAVPRRAGVDAEQLGEVVERAERVGGD